MYGVSDFRRGLKIQIDQTPYSIIDFEHVKPGKGAAFTRTKLRDLRSGRVLEHTFRSGEKILKPDVFECFNKLSDFRYRFVFKCITAIRDTHISKVIFLLYGLSVFTIRF